MIAWRRRFEIRRYLRTATWPFPTVFVVLGIVVGLLVPAVERAWDLDIYNDFGAGAAQSLLGAFTSGFITVLGLSFSLAIAALTFGSSSVMPRIILEWQRRQGSRIMIGILLFSVVYGFTVLGQVAPEDDPEFVAVRFAESLDGLLRRGMGEVDGVYPLELEDEDEEHRTPARPAAEMVTTIPSLRSGVVASLDVPELQALAERLDVTIELIPRIGGYVERDGDLFRVFPGS